jgi:hypothetical protein
VQAAGELKMTFQQRSGCSKFINDLFSVHATIRGECRLILI